MISAFARRIWSISPSTKHTRNRVNSIFPVIAVPLSDNGFKSQDVKDFTALITDNDSERKVNLILFEFLFLKQTRPLLPDVLSEKDMSILLSLPSVTKRKKYILRYLYKKNLLRLAYERRKADKEIKREEGKAQMLENIIPEHLIYTLYRNCLHFRVQQKVLNNFYAHRLAQAALFGQPLVFDCDFEDHMNQQECMKTAMMLQQVYGVNSTHQNPFDLHFCNLNCDLGKKSLLGNLNKLLPSLHHPTSMITVSDVSYLDLFPKEKLVYLSPNARDSMTSFDPDAVYIIGAIVDLGTKVPLTMAKAKKEGLQCLKLPLDNYLKFRPGATKDLPLNQVAQILLEMSLSGQWPKAFNHIPKRDILLPEENVNQGNYRFQKHKRYQEFETKQMPILNNVN